MRLITIVFCLSAFTGAAFGADPTKVSATTAQQDMMAKMKEFATPGPEHKVLAGAVGNWSYTSKFWEKADTKPEESKGTSSFKMILGGRWLQHTTKGKIMGMPFDGMGLTGFDKLKGKYETLWFDNMGTGVIHGTGTFDTATNTLADAGTFSCAMSGNTARAYRGEWQMKDKNNMIYTMYGPGLEDPKEFKQMEIVYKRVK